MKEEDDAVEDCVKALYKAFADCEKPRSEDRMVSVGGIDSPSAMRLWCGLEREAVANHPDFDFIAGEYLDYLSSDGMRHFLPALLELALLRPKQIDDSGLSFLVTRMEAMWAKTAEYRYYRGTRLNKKQVEAVATWCDLMQKQTTQLDPNEMFDGFRLEYFKTIREVRKHLPAALKCTDYDADYRKELGSKGSKAPGDRTSRRHGWQHFKNKKGKRPRE